MFGLLSDFFVFIIVSGFLWIYSIFLSNSKYSKPWGFVIFGLLVTLLVYISFFNTILNEYGGALPTIGISFVALKTICFGLLLFLPKFRKQFRLIFYSITLFIFVLLIVQNALSEFFFWNEFGLKYNFIAVNYLVYTNEVIGNIIQSYPILPIVTFVGIISLLSTYYIVKKTKHHLDNLLNFKDKISYSIVYMVLFIVSLWTIPIIANQENSKNIFTNELEANGLYKFYCAFMNSELDYFKLYKTLPENEVINLLSHQISDISGKASLHSIVNNQSEIHKNVVLITIESFSAEFMKSYGNKNNLTPFLDSLANQSMQFTNLYAVGNRTVRGLEAVTLCLPPTAGESVIKRKDNKNKFSSGSIFSSKGYRTKYLYGGDAYFDNMEDFFGGNGYDIVDKKTFRPNEITFDNIWGVCDEDLYTKAIQVMNLEATSTTPFFNHIMTVSNHRPFTYPNNKIDIPGDAKSRDGGVKYTDYALKKFFEMAQKQSWFNDTVFIIVADHCASSAGKTELPLDKYRIPAMIFSPGFIKPQIINQLMSQIDLMPTAMGLLHFSYSSKFYGQDVFQAGYKPRAFIATYQDLGLIKDGILTVLSPKKTVKQYQLQVDLKKDYSAEFPIYYTETPIKTKRINLINETISYYQSASAILKKKEYQR
jgi:phosphoglycerol transferase MdoB-like AlkP superfamily enzyme